MGFAFCSVCRNDDETKDGCSNCGGKGFVNADTRGRSGARAGAGFASSEPKGLMGRMDRTADGKPVQPRPVKQHKRPKHPTPRGQGGAKTLKAKYRGQCASCERWFPAGASILWRKGQAWHKSCPTPKKQAS